MVGLQALKSRSTGFSGTGVPSTLMGTAATPMGKMRHRSLLAHDPAYRLL